MTIDTDVRKMAYAKGHILNQMAQPLGYDIALQYNEEEDYLIQLKTGSQIILSVPFMQGYKIAEYLNNLQGYH